MDKAIIILPAYADHSLERPAMAELGLRVEEIDLRKGRAEARAALGEARIVFVRDTVLDADLINAMTRCVGIVRYGIGIDNIDVAAANARGITVARVPDYGAEIEVADHAVALFLAVRRRIVSRDAQVRKGAWQVGQTEPIYRIAGSTAGFIGFGRIARAVADRLRAFGVTQAVVYDPYLDPATLPEWARRADDLNELAEQSDIVSLHAPATPENRHLINADFLSRMRPTAVLINTARGQLVDEQALANALEKGTIFGAGIDVFSVEPPVGSPLLRAPNVVLSDHNGWYSETTVRNIQSGAVEQARKILLNA